MQSTTIGDAVTSVFTGALPDGARMQLTGTLRQQGDRYLIERQLEIDAGSGPHWTTPRVHRIMATDATADALRAHIDQVITITGTVGLPKRIAVDHGPEFISKALDAWAYRNQVTLEFSRLGKPTDNAFAESFNGHLRAECLDQHWFETLTEAKEVIEAWRVDDNEERPHRSLQQQTPAAVLASWQPSEKAAD